jgi:hypothetical protein
MLGLDHRPRADATMMISRDPNKRLVLFHRDFQRFTGGHLKVWNYFNHVIGLKSFEPRIAFTADSKFDDTNPWSTTPEYVTEWKPETADVLFLGGKDWKNLSEETRQNFRGPIINLIQHPRHADPNDELYGFLSSRAVRICVSQQTADAIQATGKVNGPVFVIPNGISFEDVPAQAADHKRGIEVLICGLKAPELARQIEKRFRNDENVAITSQLEWIPRAEYLKQLSQARIVVTLPRPTEGFYLPALEAMACGTVVVCPDCIGNRDFCHDGVNCFRPQYVTDEIVAAIYRALSLSPKQMSDIRKQADDTVREHSLERERGKFLEILERVDEIWRG